MLHTSSDKRERVRVGIPEDDQDMNKAEREPSTPDFYAEGSESEASRLDMMAQIANVVSIDMVQSLAVHLRSGGLSIPDIGAGDSTRLAADLTAKGHRDIALDMRQGAVDAHLAAGYDAVKSLATELAIESGSIDISHARFTWAWLSDVERMQSLAEMLRIGRDDMAISIVDYDWSTIEGPQIFLDKVAHVKAIMQQTGFEPDYGARVATDLDKKLSSLIHGAYTIVTARDSSYTGPINGGLDNLIAPTVHAIVTQLLKIDKTTEAETLLVDLEELYDYAAEHPDEQVRLPDIVAAGVVVADKDERISPTMRTYLDAVGNHQDRQRAYDIYKEGVDFVRALTDVPSAHRVVIATSEDMILAARRIQTTAYYRDEIIGFDALGANGVLVDGNDPMELVNRSIYFVPLDEQTNWMNGVVRIIKPTADEGVWSLPTVKRISQHSTEAVDKLQIEPFMQEFDNTVEVSGLAKNMLGGTLEDVMLAMVVLSEVTIRSGYRYGIMGLQESKVELIEHLFGTEAIHRIDGEDVAHHIDLPGVKDDSLFVPLYVDGEKFIEEVYQYARNRRGRLFTTLTQVASEIRSTHQA